MPFTMENSSRKTLSQIIQYGLLLLAIGAFSFFLYYLLSYGSSSWELPYFSLYCKVIFLVLSISLLANLIFETVDALQEWSISQEIPPAELSSEIKQGRFQIKGSWQPLLQNCTELLQEHFSRFSTIVPRQSSLIGIPSSYQILIPNLFR